MNTPSQKKLLNITQAEKYLGAFLPRLQEKRVQSFTTITLSLITLSFFGIFAISPTLSTIANLQKQITDNQFVNEQLQQKISSLSDLQESYTKIQKDLPVVYEAVPQTPEVTKLVGQLQTIAQSTQVSLESVSTLPVDVSSKSNVKYNSFTFALDVFGSYDAIQTFLQQLTSFDRLVSTDALTLSKPIAGQDAYRLSIRGEAFFQSK